MTETECLITLSVYSSNNGYPRQLCILNQLVKVTEVNTQFICDFIFVVPRTDSSLIGEPPSFCKGKYTVVETGISLSLGYGNPPQGRLCLDKRGTLGVVTSFTLRLYLTESIELQV